MPESWKECEGQLIDGQFSLIEHVGGSDHSVVFRTQRGKNQPEKAAIKFVQVDPANAEGQLARWKQAAQLSHPNLIRLFESGRCKLADMDLLYVVMEFASENLAQFLPQRALTPEEARDMLEPFIGSLTYLHGKGFVHGDIKPSNILAIDDQLKLSSDSIQRIGEGPIGDTRPEAYTAPEATHGEFSRASDIWALGVTLVESLTQRVPDAAEVTSGDLQVPDSLPEPFLDIVRHAVRSKPGERWTITQISAKLNPQAATPAAVQTAAETLSDTAVPENRPESPEPISAAAPIFKDSTASGPVSPPKPATSIDPLSVPLSTVGPLLGGKRAALDNQVLSGPRKPARGYYLFAALVLALTIGAMLAIPRFRSHQAEAENASASPSGEASTQPATSAEVSKTAPPLPSDLQPKSEPSVESKSAVPSHSPYSPTTPHSKATPIEDSAAATAGKQPGKTELSAANSAPASLKSVPGAARVTAAPFVPDREASIKAGAVTPGEVLNQVLPEVSEKSRSTIHGTVRTVIKVHVDTAGSVSTAQIASGGSRFFASAALDAARQWDFAPAKVDGHAVPSEWLLHFDFTPTGTKVTPLPTKP
jgi:TonB family protein